MVTELTNTIDILNNLYHAGINGDIDSEQKFKKYLTTIHKEEITFKSKLPDEVAYENLALNSYELKLLEKLKLMRLEIGSAARGNLWRYSANLRDVEKGLIHELSTLLMKRGALEKRYFWELSSKKEIAFNWSGNEIDLYVWIKK